MSETPRAQPAVSEPRAGAPAVGPPARPPWRRLVAAGWRPGGALVVLVIFAVFPLVVTNPTVTTIAVDTLIFAASAVAWNLFSGYSGYISLGQAVFFGTGVYVVGIAARAWHLTGDTVFALLPLAGALAAALLMTTAESLVDIWSPDWAVVVFYLVLVLVLVFRPAGLFGRRTARAQ